MISTVAPWRYLVAAAGVEECSICLIWLNGGYLATGVGRGISDVYIYVHA